MSSLSLHELFELFPDDATAERHFAEAGWPDGAHCPFCRFPGPRSLRGAACAPGASLPSAS